MLTAKSLWTAEPMTPLYPEELAFQKKVLVCKGPKSKTAGGNNRHKVWRFINPYTEKEFTGERNWYNFFTDKSQEAMRKFIADPKNIDSTWCNVTDCKITYIHDHFDGSYSALTKPGLLPLNLLGGMKRIALCNGIQRVIEETPVFSPKPLCGPNYRTISPADMFQSKLMTLTEIRYGGKKHGNIYFKGLYGGEGVSRKMKAVKKISAWFLNVSYDPQYKFCREKQWKEFQAICEDE